MTNRQLRVFLCHSSKDKSAVRELYKKLRGESWIDPWLDEEKLLPGQDWHMEIEKAVEVTDVVVVLLSNQSVSQEGYVQRELKLALDVADEKPEGIIFIAPLRLDDCPAPRRLRDWHYVDYFPADRKDWAVERLIASLKTRADTLGLQFEEPITLQEKPIAATSRPTPVVSSSPIKSATIQNKLTFSNGMEFMRVPVGKFIMGSNNEYDEKPRNTIDILYDYWIGRYLVTNTQYNQFEEKGFDKGKEHHPVISVSWNEATEYCQWLNKLLRVELPANMILRLPTESEWEKAARGTDGRKYPWGNTFDKNKCNSYEGGKSDTTSVGLYSPQGDSPYGCADMSGNVLEWTHSEYKAYPYDTSDGREEESKSVERVLRGGSFKQGFRDARCAYRDQNYPHRRHDDYSFRVVLSPILPS